MNEDILLKKNGFIKKGKNHYKRVEQKLSAEATISQINLHYGRNLMSIAHHVTTIT